MHLASNRVSLHMQGFPDLLCRQQLLCAHVHITPFRWITELSTKPRYNTLSSGTVPPVQIYVCVGLQVAIHCQSGLCVPQLIPHEFMIGHGLLSHRVVCECDAESCPAMTLKLEVSAELIREGEDQFESERCGRVKMKFCWESYAIISHGQDILTILVIHRNMDFSFATIREAVFQRI